MFIPDHWHVVEYPMQPVYNTREWCHCGYPIGEENETRFLLHWASWDEETSTLTTHFPFCRCLKCLPLLRSYVDKTEPERAKELFFEYLTPQQRYDYDTYGYVDVLAVNGGKWRLDCMRGSGNSTMLRPCDDKDGQMGWYAYCIVAIGVPRHDQYIAQVLMLKTDPLLFLRIAERVGWSSLTSILSENPWTDPDENPPVDAGAWRNGSAADF